MQLHQLQTVTQYIYICDDKESQRDIYKNYEKIGTWGKKQVYPWKDIQWFLAILIIIVFLFFFFFSFFVFFSFSPFLLCPYSI